MKRIVISLAHKIDFSLATKPQKSISLLKAMTQTILVSLALFFLIYYLAGNTEMDQTDRAILWLFYFLISYALIDAVLVLRSDEPNVFEFAFIIKMIMALILLAGFICHFFINFPLPFQAVLGWPAAVSFGILIIMTLIETIFYFFSFRFAP